MRALDRKMLRDLKSMRGQAVAIAFVLMSGVATFVALSGTMDSLQRTLSLYYEDYRFTEVFASLKRAPESVRERIRQIPGVGEVQTRVVAQVNLQIIGFDEPVSGLIVSIPEAAQPELNRLFLREGRLVRTGVSDEVIVHESFADAHRFEPGDEMVAIINGKRRNLRIVGIALSPEFLYQFKPGSLFPDPLRYGVLWMGRESLSSAYDMQGAFNDVAITLAPGVDARDVIDYLDDCLKPYGGQGAYERKDQQSHLFITEEFRQLEGTSTMLPAIFLAVAAFLLNIVVTRLISTQREQIAILKAFGYANLDIGFHYTKLVLFIVAVGVLGGTLLGIWFGREMSGMYMMYYRFPYLEFELRTGVILTAVLVTTLAALSGAIYAVRRAVRLSPAESMRPEPPATFRATVIERLGLQRFFDQPTRMIGRQLERRPLKALVTVTGIASACAILIMGLFFVDAFDHIVEVQFGLAEQEDYAITFAQPTSMHAVYELQGMEGVWQVEPFRSIPVRLHQGHRSYRTAIEGLLPEAVLHRPLTAALEPIEIPHEGLVLSDRLAERLQAGPGDLVRVEVLEGRRPVLQVPVAGLASQYIGLGAYMDIHALNRLMRDGQVISGAYLTLDPRRWDRTVSDLQQRPVIAGMAALDDTIRSFMESTAEIMLSFTFILSLFAAVIAFGVVYNSARISLSERDRELASLRVLGFTRGEISYILLGELAFLTLLAIPFGFLLGWVAGVAIVSGLETDLYRIPLVIKRDTFAFAAAVVLASSAISALIVRRKLDKLDLVGVLKTRE